MTESMQKLISELGALVRADERCRALEAAVDAYERSEDLNALISEYNVQQNLLADSVGQGNETVREAVQGRIDTLYDMIKDHPVYRNYEEAKTAFDALTNELWGELQYAVTGQRPCSHDCSTCAGCH